MVQPDARVEEGLSVTLLGRPEDRKDHTTAVHPVPQAPSGLPGTGNAPATQTLDQACALAALALRVLRRVTSNNTAYGVSVALGTQ